MKHPPAGQPLPSRTLDDLETPRVVVDLDRLEANLGAMQGLCDRNGVELWPHIKTHKSVEIARRQLRHGARGLTCAKIGEAEAMLPSGVRRIFIAHSIVDPRSASRLAALAARLEELILAVTSPEQARALEAVLAGVGLTLPVMMALDTGLGREGARSPETARALADALRGLPHLRLRGFYTHEGHGYGLERESLPALAAEVVGRMDAIRNSIDPSLSIWPGSSSTAARVATLPGVNAIRPGSYVYGDLSLCVDTGALGWENAALTILATVIDRPEPELVLIDAGSKTFSSDKSSRDGSYGIEREGRTLRVCRVNEEHGYLRGEATAPLRVGDRLHFVPAHVCPVLNLADETVIVQGNQIVGFWPVDGRGCNR